MPQQAFGAIGCTLSNPAEDLKYLYPEMTTYKEELNEFPRLKNGAELFKGLRARLGSDLDPIYETFETPYTVYSVFKGQRKIGVVHGVNVPGKGGVIQVFLSLDPETAEIKSLFFQRLESPAARAAQEQGISRAVRRPDAGRLLQARLLRRDRSRDEDRPSGRDQAAGDRCQWAAGLRRQPARRPKEPDPARFLCLWQKIRTIFRKSQAGSRKGQGSKGVVV